MLRSDGSETYLPFKYYQKSYNISVTDRPNDMHVRVNKEYCAQLIHCEYTLSYKLAYAELHVRGSKKNILTRCFIVLTLLSCKLKGYVEYYDQLLYCINTSSRLPFIIESRKCTVTSCSVVYTLILG